MGDGGCWVGRERGRLKERVWVGWGESTGWGGGDREWGPGRMGERVGMMERGRI